MILRRDDDMVESGRLLHLQQHIRVIMRLEGLGRDYGPRADLPHAVIHLRLGVHRIDPRDDQTRPGGPHVRDYPLDAVGTPDADAVALLQADLLEARRYFVRSL